ncbi:MAG: cyclase [Chloroflexi bacterium OLB15]|nr:MAG: cyclase [Chloroflexi bacterium OLB15]
MTIYDITRTVTPEIAVWPGDQHYSVKLSASLEQGDSVNLTTLVLSPHTGSHADAAFHTEHGGTHPAAEKLDAFLGIARVVTVSKRDGALLPSDFPEGSLEGVQRLLIHSHVSDSPDERWPDVFPYLSEILIQQFAEQGGLLIGLDSPSVDAFDSKALHCHHALRRCGLFNLETLCLAGVPDGDYELIALPLKLDLACASPVRAILRTL